MHHPNYTIDFTTSKPSAIIRAALRDLEAVEARDEYVVDMGTWHEPIYETAHDFDYDPDAERRCGVCLAGAVIARVTGYNDNADISPHQFDTTTEFVFDALDNIRRPENYAIESGVKRLCETLGQSLPPYGIVDDFYTSYAEEPTRFKADRHKLADRLEDAGL